MKKFLIGPFLIMIAAGLWALDALIRAKLTQNIPSTSIVLFEHAIGFIILSPIFIKSLQKYKSLKSQDWAILLTMTIVSSVAGGVMFTEAFARSAEFYDFVTPVLLQKLQPVFVVILSFIFLNEKINIRFVALGILALIGSYMISFGTEAIDLTITNKEVVYLLAIGAAFGWGAGTILSKKILTKLNFAEATSMRFLLAIPVSMVFVLALGQQYSPLDLTFADTLRFIIIAMTTGAAAILIYYKGLANSEARVSTFAELTFPIVSILIAVTALNPYGDAQKLLLANIFGIIILLLAILLISFENKANEKPAK